jgi:hypothetical protein
MAEKRERCCRGSPAKGPVRLWHGPQYVGEGGGRRESNLCAAKVRPAALVLKIKHYSKLEYFFYRVFITARRLNIIRVEHGSNSMPFTKQMGYLNFETLRLERRRLVSVPLACLTPQYLSFANCTLLTFASLRISRLCLSRAVRKTAFQLIWASLLFEDFCCTCQPFVRAEVLRS